MYEEKHKGSEMQFYNIDESGSTLHVEINMRPDTDMEWTVRLRWKQVAQ